MSFFNTFQLMRNVAIRHVTKGISNPLIMIFPVAQCKKKLEEETIKAAKQNENKPDPIKFVDRPLTHEYLIQQACTANVNSASQLLTQTTVAILDTGTQYRKKLESMRQLLADSLESLAAGITDQSEMTDQLTVIRSDVDEHKKALLELTGLMNCVEKLVQTTAETAFIAGAESICNQMSERLQAAQKELLVDREKTKDLERECLELQAQIVNSDKQKKKKPTIVQKPQKQQSPMH